MPEHIDIVATIQTDFGSAIQDAKEFSSAVQSAEESTSKLSQTIGTIQNDSSAKGAFGSALGDETFGQMEQILSSMHLKGWLLLSAHQ